MNLRTKTSLILMILLIFISILLSGCSLLRGIIPSLPNKGAGSVHILIKDSYYNTIQEALDNANSGDTIEVSNGTYDESITFPSGKMIILQSVNGHYSTIIRGDGGSDTITFDNSLTGTTLKGFTVTHADGQIGRGIYIIDGNLTINNCTIFNNTADYGGGIRNDGHLTITASTICYNSAADHCGGGIENCGSLTITQSRISNNTANYGGGIRNYNHLTITESRIFNNSAYSQGGGIYNDYDGLLTITESTISNNTANYGGGIYNKHNGSLTITSSTLCNNSAADHCGGGICNDYDGLLTITGSMISGNTADYGGGIYIYSYSVTIVVGGEGSAEKNTICGNYKSGYNPSPDQQIRDVSGSLYETYKDNNYISAYCIGDNPPTIEIISPSDGEIVSGTIRFSSDALDDYALDKVEFYIDDELKSTHGPLSCGYYHTVGSRCNWDCDTTPGSITYIPDGPHNFKAKAYDTAGQTAVDNISFIVENHNITANAHSAHFADGYYVELMINDPEQKVQSVTVGGPGIDGSISLLKGVHPFYPNQWWSKPSVNLGDNPPDLPLDYTFTITDKKGTTYKINDSVQSYVGNFATNLSPEGTQTSGDSLVFLWTGVEIGGVKYKVELYDKNWNRIWDSTLITDTSFTYNGPVLASGDYQYFVCVFDGYGNESLAYQNFQIKALPTPPLNCAIELKKCSSEPYLEPGMPLCWPVYFIGLGASFNIYVGGSTGDIKRVRFLSDESQNGIVDQGFTWTRWYDWDISSDDWYHLSKTMTWSFATGGEKEVWAEIEDSACQTRRCAENIVIPESLPDRISLDDVEISTIISYLTQYMSTLEPWPVFLKASLPDLNISANILLIASKDPVTEYKLVNIKTNHVTDPRDLKLYSVLPSTPTGCVKNYVQNMLTDWFTNFGQELGNKILIEIGRKIVGTALGIGIPASAVSFSYSLIECIEEGYAEPLEEWNAGEDYLVYLPIDLPEGLDLTIKPKRGICYCEWATSPWIFCQDCPGQVQGMWKGRISDVTSEISIDIEETENWWAKIFKIFSSAELRVYDSQGRVSGLVNGVVKEEIPNSVYDEENKAVGIFFPTDSCLSEIVGTREGNYGLQVVSVEDGEVTTFTATDIPTRSGAVHQYTIDWDALSRGGEGVTVQIDFDGDGTSELTITTNSTFTFVPATISIKPDTLNLNSKIKWVTAYIKLPEDYDVTNIDVNTVNLWYEGNNVPAEWGDIQDGTLMVKFDGEVVQGLFTGPVDVATVEVAGELQDGTPFGGNDTIRVIKKP